MKILVTGARDWEDQETITMVAQTFREKGVTVVVEGGAFGVDLMIRKAAEYEGLEVREYPADWKAHGKAAGPIRNRQMFDTEQPDGVVGIHDKLWDSKGTLDMLKYADHQGCDVILIRDRHDAEALANWLDEIKAFRAAR